MTPSRCRAVPGPTMLESRLLSHRGPHCSSASPDRRDVISFCARPAIGVPCSRSWMAFLSLPYSGWWQAGRAQEVRLSTVILNAPAQCDSPTRFGYIKFP